MAEILAPMTLRPDLPKELRDRAFNNFERLHDWFKDNGWVADIPVFNDVFPKWYPTENYWARFARMRNEVITRHLRPEHEWVLWIDADVSFEPNIFDKLLIDGDFIISPLVLVENSDLNYDTAGFRQAADHRSNQAPPYFDDVDGERMVQLQCVGACVLVPADMHRHFQFEAMPDDEPQALTEWWRFCQNAINVVGLQVVCDTSVKVYHAELPNYGEAWH